MESAKPSGIRSAVSKMNFLGAEIMIDGVAFGDDREILAECRAWLREVTYKDWRFTIEVSPFSAFLLIEFHTHDNFGPGTVTIRKVSNLAIRHPVPHRQFLIFVMRAILEAENHEAMEKFRFRDEIIFNPHHPSPEYERVDFKSFIS
jgi:hypothetical protein